jgi:hypothetical protein
MFISHQKGRSRTEKQECNFGMPHPEGYRKAARLMKQAEKFNIPIISLIDTPGAFPGLEDEECGQSEAIAANLYLMSRLQVPIIAIVIGEQALPGALVFAWADTVDCTPTIRPGHTPATHTIVLELRSVTGVQQGTRHEKHAAERLVARQAVCSAASRLPPLHAHQALDIYQAPGGRPLLQSTEHDLATTNRVCLSLSHCSDWAAAALGGTIPLWLRSSRVTPNSPSRAARA